MSVRLSCIWEEQLCSDRFVHLMELSVHHAHNTLDDAHEHSDAHETSKNTTDDECTEGCDAECTEYCGAHKLTKDREEFAGKARNLAQILNEACCEAFPACAALLVDTILLIQTIGNGPAILVTVLGCASILLFSYINSHEWLTGKHDTLRRTKCNFEQAVRESFQNWTTVHCFNKSEQEEARLRGLHDKYDAADRNYNNSFITVESTQQIYLLLLRYAAALFAMDRISQGIASVGDLVILLNMWNSLFLPIITIVDQVRQIGSVRGTVEEMEKLRQKTPKVTDTSSRLLVAKDGRVVFENVSFSYGNSKPVLRDISLTAEPGTTIALVGQPGSGKSTILDLLLRFHDVGQGSISIGGQDIRHVSLGSLRDSLGVVSHNTKLFSRSIRDNLKYGRPDATDDEMREACKLVAIHEKIEEFGDGYSTTLTADNLRQLDDEEVQRIAIARAVIKRPRLFVVDEPAASVDSATVLRILGDACTGQTTFIATRRPSMAVSADLILVLEEGRIVEKGTYHELLELGGKYCSMSKE